MGLRPTCCCSSCRMRWLTPANEEMSLRMRTTSLHVMPWSLCSSSSSSSLFLLAGDQAVATWSRIQKAAW